ncbi:MAG: phospho-N-acetylmuramoyl-pentapeptide-transferase, partial [Defluviitaleaceae bacterium]|nr:phospho-N-acetylmuramoyl-pentapeptide-transferase [Defluviitaleaceae bacterium]
MTTTAYISFNTAVLTALIAFGVAIVLGPIAIPILRKLKFGQNVRDDGPKSHLSKAGVPSMGGFVIIVAIAVASGIFSGFIIQWQIIMYLMLSFGFIGFLDDYIKIVRKRSLGLRAWQKFSLQLFASLVFVLLLHINGISNHIYIPFTHGMYVDLSWFSPVFIMLVVIGTANGANFTDGLDGLASGVTLLISLFFLYVAFVVESPLVFALAAAAGALLGFLLFNSYPARVFLAVTGSLPLGGSIAGCAIFRQLPRFIL